MFVIYFIPIFEASYLTVTAFLLAVSNTEGAKFSSTAVVPYKGIMNVYVEALL